MLIGSLGDRQVHELHPSHPFLIVPDKPIEEASSEYDYSQIMANPHEELCTYRGRIQSTRSQSTMDSSTYTPGSEMRAVRR